MGCKAVADLAFCCQWFVLVGAAGLGGVVVIKETEVGAQVIVLSDDSYAVQVMVNGVPVFTTKPDAARLFAEWIVEAADMADGVKPMGFFKA